MLLDVLKALPFFVLMFVIIFFVAIMAPGHEWLGLAAYLPLVYLVWRSDEPEWVEEERAAREAAGEEEPSWLEA